MKTESRKELQWLQQLVGEWTFEGEATMAPGQSPEKFTGSETVRSMGEVWFLAEGQTEMSNYGPATMMMTLGYDPEKERYVGTWIGSMMTHLVVYDGALDADGRTLTLDTEGPPMTTEGTMTKLRDVIEVKSDDHRVLTSHGLGEDGQWHQFMTASYRRKR
jgi:hypothetical protein